MIEAIIITSSVLLLGELFFILAAKHLSSEWDDEWITMKIFSFILAGIIVIAVVGILTINEAEAYTGEYHFERLLYFIIIIPIIGFFKLNHLLYKKITG